MKHRLFTLVAATSLLLCLGCVGMWVRSGFVEDSAIKSFGGGQVWAWFSTGGNLRLLMQQQSPPIGDGEITPWHWSLGDGHDQRPAWNWMLPTYRTGVATTPSRRLSNRQLVLPYWLPTLISSLLPALWFWQRRRQKQGMRGRGFEVLPAPAAKTGP